MSSKAVNEYVVQSLLKGPFAIFLFIALAIWYASKMTADQLATLDKLFVSLQTPVGAAFYTLIAGLVLYSLVLWPLGKFIRDITHEFVDGTQAHHVQQVEHINGSRETYKEILELKTEFEDGKSELRKMNDRINKILEFYEKA